MKKVFEFNFRGKKLIVENGEMAKQSNAAVLVRYEDTVVLTALNRKTDEVETDFFPLMVLYQEKQYAVGKIPGGFIKRETRPTEAATLAARLIDRPLRPLFPEGFNKEVQIVNTILSVDTESSPEMSAMFGSSLATCISDVPFDGPIAGVIVGRVDGHFIINPTPTELEKSDINLTVSGTMNAINMVEAGSKEVSEEDMLEAIMFGHEAIKELIQFQLDIIKEIGLPKMEFLNKEIDSELKNYIDDIIGDKLVNAIKIFDKQLRADATDLVKQEVLDNVVEANKDNSELETIKKATKKYLEKLEYDIVRHLISVEKIRPDGRLVTEIRPLSSSIDILPRAHGSALFTRGQTQALSITTLGAANEYQILDGLSDEVGKRFMLHYNFPQFSVGETGRYGAPGRREIGHGALGERALLQVMPSEEEFPYTIRVVSEILESNGSSSQASICAACLSLMAAGVPIKAPVAGIAMGLMTLGEDYTILTDIQGLEDHLGDMDFKVAGTKKGICALQMDIKIKGITKQILKEALEQAKVARFEILESIAKTLEKPRLELSKYAPKIKQIYIKPEKIKDVIGRGGEMITKIILDASNVLTVNDKDAVKVDLEDDGRVIVYHQNIDIINKTIEMILNIVKEVEENVIYTAKVVKVEDFGCFVQVWPGCEGLVHISQLDEKRIEKTSDIVKVGDEILVKYIGLDKKGKLNFSRKEAMK
ncbi:MAG: polyribonucleotide nucleotidyltransferase [Bacilli bacterium]